jgi:hypothetical protein
MGIDKVKLAEGTIVITDMGYKKVENIAGGRDRVLSLGGKYNDVGWVYKEPVENVELRSLTLNGMFVPIVLDYNRKIRAMIGKDINRRGSKPEWMNVSEIDAGDFVVFDVDRHRPEMEMTFGVRDAYMAEFLGYYVCNGFIDYRKNKVIIHLGRDRDLDKSIIKCAEMAFDMKIEPYTFDQEFFISVESEEAMRICEQFGRKNNEKKIPESVLSSDDLFLKEFMRSFFKLNQSKGKKEYFKASSSMDLLKGYQRILFRLNAFSNIYECRSKDGGFKYYALTLNSKEAERAGTDVKETWFKEDGLIYLRVESKKNIMFTGNTYEFLIDDGCYCDLMLID